MSDEKRLIDLTEYEVRLVSPSELAEPDGRKLWTQYGEKVEVQPPTFQTDNVWRLRSLGWVGYIPLGPHLGIRLAPKVPIGNLFRMLEYAYQLRSFEFLEGFTDAATLEEAFDRLANVLAKRVLDRHRKGFHRAYLGQEESLPYIRGSLDLSERLRRPWTVRLPCTFDEHTADIEDNRILLWTLQEIARSGICTPRTIPNVRRAYRSLLGAAALEPILPKDCVDRLYTRLNTDYEPLHALCRFFLEHAGPTHDAGDRRMLPFLVDMARLFELFVAEWLRGHLPKAYRLKYQENVKVGETGGLSFAIDMVLYDALSGEPLAVMDTKYKAPQTPSTDDVQQIVAYAESKDCRRAILVYPTVLDWRAKVGKIEVFTLPYLLHDDLEDAGRNLMRHLLPSDHLSNLSHSDD